jgi:hypothetical protein
MCRAIDLHRDRNTMLLLAASKHAGRSYDPYLYGRELLSINDLSCALDKGVDAPRCNDNQEQPRTEPPFLRIRRNDPWVSPKDTSLDSPRINL